MAFKRREMMSKEGIRSLSDMDPEVTALRRAHRLRKRILTCTNPRRA